MDKSELKKLSKIELEKLGRTKGVELDRRFNKKTLIEQISSLFIKEPKEVPAAAIAVEIKPVKVLHVTRSFRVKPGKSNS